MASPSGQEGDQDPLQESKAYSNSIYLMLGMPYLLLGCLGLLMYRAASVAARKARAEGLQAPGLPDNEPGPAAAADGPPSESTSITTELS